MGLQSILTALIGCIMLSINYDIRANFYAFNSIDATQRCEKHKNMLYDASNFIHGLA